MRPDRRGGATDKVQESRLRATIALVADTLAAGKHMGRARRLNVSMLNVSIGSHLRHLREERLGRWQGSLDVPARSIVLSVGFSNIREEFRTELLVLALREGGIDARSIMLDDDDDETRAPTSPAHARARERRGRDGRSRPHAADSPQRGGRDAHRAAGRNRVHQLDMVRQAKGQRTLRK